MGFRFPCFSNTCRGSNAEVASEAWVPLKPTHVSVRELRRSGVLSCIWVFPSLLRGGVSGCRVLQKAAVNGGAGSNLSLEERVRARNLLSLSHLSLSRRPRVLAPCARALGNTSPHTGSKSSFSIALIFTANRWNPASASTHQWPGKDDLIP